MVVLCLKMLLAFVNVALPGKKKKELNPILNVLIRKERGKSYRQWRVTQ